MYFPIPHSPQAWGGGGVGGRGRISAIYPSELLYAELG